MMLRLIVVGVHLWATTMKPLVDHCDLCPSLLHFDEEGDGKIADETTEQGR